MPNPNKIKTEHPSFSALGKTMVTILVGPEKEPYSVHVDLLTYYSEYFRAAFKGSFKEADERKTNMEDVTERTFSYFMDWLYHQTLSCGFLGCPLSSKMQRSVGSYPSQGFETPMHEDLVELYILGDRYEIPNLRKDVIDHMYEDKARFEVIPGYHRVIRAFESLPNTSPLCRYIVDSYCDGGYRPLKEDSMDAQALYPSLPHDFLLKIMHKSLENTADYAEGKVPKSMDICDYHEHADAEEREDCRKERRIMA